MRNAKVPSNPKFAYYLIFNNTLLSLAESIISQKSFSNKRLIVKKAYVLLNINRLNTLHQTWKQLKVFLGRNIE